MREALLSFEVELDKLLKFLDASGQEEELVAALAERSKEDNESIGAVLRALRANITIKRRQGYVSSVIVLYGALERFIEEAVAEYVAELVNIYKVYDLLPENLRDRHTKLTIDYLASLKDGKVRETEGIESIIDALHGCLTGAASFRLNARAFSLRSSNMNIKRVREVVGHNLGINLTNKRILKSESYRAYLERVGETPPEKMQDGAAAAQLKHVDELVSVRNDIAHGVSNLDEFEDGDLVRERSLKLQAFVRSVNEIFDCELMEARIALGHVVPISGAIKVFRGGVVCFEWPSGSISIGDILVMRSASDGSELRYGAVESIQVDNADREAVDGSEGLMVGVRVGFKAKSNGAFFIWPKWSQAI